MDEIDHQGLKLEHTVIDGWHVFVAPEVPGAAAARRDRNEALAAVAEAAEAIVAARGADAAGQHGEAVVHAGRLLSLQHQEIGEWSVYTAPDFPELHSCHRNRALALAAVPSALVMVDRIKARLLSRQACAGGQGCASS